MHVYRGTINVIHMSSQTISKGQVSKPISTSICICNSPANTSAMGRMLQPASSSYLQSLLFLRSSNRTPLSCGVAGGRLLLRGLDVSTSSWALLFFAGEVSWSACTFAGFSASTFLEGLLVRPLLILSLLTRKRKIAARNAAWTWSAKWSKAGAKLLSVYHKLLARLCSALSLFDLLYNASTSPKKMSPSTERLAPSSVADVCSVAT